MLLYANDKVKILVAGDTLQYGDMAVIKKVLPVNVERPYYCFCPLRKVGEWFPERHLDKIKPKTKARKKIILRFRHNHIPVVRKPIADPEPKVIKRFPAIYDNGKSLYGIDYEKL